jgi:hypothetical protein
MKKALMVMVFITTLMLLPTITVIAGTPVKLSGAINGNILNTDNTRVTKNTRKLHIRYDFDPEAPPEPLLDLFLHIDSLYYGEHNVWLFEVRINLKNSRASMMWVWRDGDISYRLYCYGTGEGGSGTYKIHIDEAEGWIKVPRERGKARFKRDWSLPCDPETTKLGIDILS